METNYDIFRKLENGEKLLIASMKKRRQAEQLLRSFSEQWPATYVIQEIKRDFPPSSTTRQS